MKTIYTAFVVIVFSIIFISTTHATVGGPTLIYDFKYDTKTSLVYYTEQNQGGKGCPPVLKSISLTSDIPKVIYSCDEGLALPVGMNQEEKIQNFTSGFDYLTPTNLRKNNIHVTVDVVNTENPTNDMFTAKTNFLAHVFQGKTELTTIPFSGCSIDQPLIISGYRIAGMKDKLVLLFSGKGDCFEGGYTVENLHIVSQVNIIDESDISGYKWDTALVPDEGSLVVYPGVAEKNSMTLVILSTLIAFVFGILIGRRIKS